MPEFLDCTATLIGIVFILIVAVIAVAIVYDSLRLGISPMPSSRKLIAALNECLPEIDRGSICELGAGWGGVTKELSAVYDGCHITAYENALIPGLFLIARFSRYPAVTVCRLNFLECPLPQAKLYYTYLYPRGMEQLAEKLKSELHNDAVWVSFTFALPGHTPDEIITLSDLYQSKLYIYHLSASVSA